MRAGELATFSVCFLARYTRVERKNTKNRLNGETIGAALGAARRRAAQPMWTTQRFNRGVDGRRLAFPWRGASAPGVNPALQYHYLPSGSLKRNERVSAQNQIFFLAWEIGCVAWERVKTCKSVCHTAKQWELAALVQLSRLTYVTYYIALIGCRSIQLSEEAFSFLVRLKHAPYHSPMEQYQTHILTRIMSMTTSG